MEARVLNCPTGYMALMAYACKCINSIISIIRLLMQFTCIRHENCHITCRDILKIEEITSILRLRLLDAAAAALLLHPEERQPRRTATDCLLNP